MIGEQNEWKKNDRRMGRRKVSEMSLYKGDSKSAKEIERENENESVRQTNRQTRWIDWSKHLSTKSSVVCCPVENLLLTSQLSLSCST